ncbi:LysM peptidoglycan-binding domain-containing protein [Sporosarcina pasteurii]|uniref:Sporulation-specific glycosylase ydhD n=1 Tax=Sporosarcina pasteurii TaxID=1474 RepID=A0A380C7F0_SPOPA|nr:LysM peptidoglycan-binding domain-containing protein [Sporosarcina pasteurii]MDS9473023.1 LysM peptidoglycan-binding domain-containing protein [Sporosarcina pasteurii]QBQ04532.1 LysM peptidoglycan-binding domain-containing protein [Sporosarcina pasteurii]SUJ14243.1 Putative sporulation-specific glycosylase ydhD [Sporosarcina pasteurii]
MQIHVVQRGQSLYRIARAYGISPEEIATANEIPDPSQLVTGQALVIPIEGSYHVVQPGQSLYIIGNLYGISYQELARINGISTNAILQVGQQLRIPEKQKRPINSFLYVEPRTPVAQSMIDEVRNRVGDLTFLGMFSYQVNRDGSVTPPSTANILQIADEAGVTNALVVSNLEDFAFSADLARAIFNDDAAQNQLFGNLIQIANDEGYGDIHFDFELLYPEDRELYTNFLRKARDRFRMAGLRISAAVAPKASDITTGIYGAHDYAAIGEILDYVMIMTYEWGYTFSDPQAVSPIQPVRSVMNYAASVIPNEKIFLGQNLYGYDWTFPFPPQGGPPARAISPQQAIQIALQNGAEIQYDFQAQAPFFQYTDAAGVLHEVWFEDARSIQAKFDLMNELGLGGIMYWKLGLSFPQNWLLLNDNFTIIKL